jgi:hypothetical protein
VFEQRFDLIAWYFRIRRAVCAYWVCRSKFHFVRPLPMDAGDSVLYGDIVCFFNSESDSVLNVEGFCEECAYPLEYDRVKRAVLDWSGTLFVVEPRSSCSSRQEFQSFVSDNMFALFDNSVQLHGYPSELHEQALNRKSQTAQRVAFELDAAAERLESLAGHPVKFGDVVQLRHFNSGRYFAARDSGSKGSTELVVVDSAVALECSHWRFFSRTRLSGPLKYGSEAQITSVVFDAAVAVELGATGPASYSITTTCGALSSFKLVRQGVHRPAACTLSAGDFVCISHFSSSKVLTSRYGDYLTFLNLDKQKNAEGHDPFFTPARACFVVEKASVLEPIQSKVRGSDPVRIRCVCTGEILALACDVKPENVRVPLFPVLSFVNF